MPLDHTNSSIIQFLKENYEHEKVKRVGWFLANKDTLIKEATLTEKNKGYRVDDVRRAPLELYMPMVTALHRVSAVNRRKKVPTDGPVMGLPKDKSKSDDSDTNQLRWNPSPSMKPVESSVKSILYEPFPKGGRQQYLKTRKRKIPDEKYYFCETSANVIGWQWKDSNFPHRPPKYGRHATFHHEAPRSGPQPDPKYYKELASENNKCLK